jgi:hypothetical protein
VRAERRCGELLTVTEKNRGAQGIGKSALPASEHTPKTLEQMGLTHNESSRYQQLAAMPADHFETAVATARAAVLRPRPKAWMRSICYASATRLHAVGRRCLQPVRNLSARYADTLRISAGTLVEFRRNRSRTVRELLANSCEHRTSPGRALCEPGASAHPWPPCHAMSRQGRVHLRSSAFVERSLNVRSAPAYLESTTPPWIRRVPHASARVNE